MTALLLTAALVAIVAALVALGHVCERYDARRDGRLGDLFGGDE